jgi:hypothetical protein
VPIPYTVKQGDCLSRIAAAFGFADWRTVYDAPANADFRKKRPNPNLIYPGDVVVIPDKEQRGFDVTTGARHRFKLKRPATWLRLVVDVDAPHRYLLEVGTTRARGTTDGSSPIEEKVDPLVTQGVIRLWPDAGDAPDDPPEDAIRWSLAIGSLDPIEEVSGVKGRLLNLGYYDGAVDDQVDAPTVSSIRRFRENHGLEIKDDIDEELRNKLVEMHDRA